MNICVYGASSKTIDAQFTDAGHALGVLIAQHGYGLVFGGGDNGMMGAVACGAHDGGGRVTGIAPRFFNVDGILYPHCDELIYTDTMRERKQKMEDLSGAFIVTPGGIGTFEEFFEILTLKQLNQTKKPLVILSTAGYYDSMFAMMRHTADTNFMSEKTFDLIKIVDTPEQAIEYIEHYVEREVDVEELRQLK
ncbi:TIGR00730 family Rossman fold protein [Ruminococcus sp.]|uniref:LOG family protein n=1 Tax=Ruminococcus sp. TaxID=41978 RepID=UPI002E818BD3|nr:TIGR00730 family Rossman fold protein [Ruminococcus sp.]MEE3492836.1 TIGR00730 family Rossman fold protein [Ruminococcus sp.]